MWETSLDILFSTVMRLIAAAFCGGVIGIERQMKKQAAGFRTHIVICIGSALTMMISQYLLYLAMHGDGTFASGASADVSRIGAQVISGVSFLGAGTIIMTGRRHVKGLTTSAGLWAAACMGIAVGAGFYVGALAVCFYIFISASLFAKVESSLQAKSRSLSLYLKLTELDELGELTAYIRKLNATVEDIELQKDLRQGGGDGEVVISLKLPPKTTHTEIIASLSLLDFVWAVEEI